MKQEDKQLLLKDLCSRLPYEVILLSLNRKVTYQTDGNTAVELLIEEGWKPYLRPMSSMTEQERKEYWDITSVSNHCAAIDWLNAHHFDYRGLIPKGLAIEVNESNNPYKHE
jgi:hypothetical protein